VPLYISEATRLKNHSTPRIRIRRAAGIRNSAEIFRNEKRKYKIRMGSPSLSSPTIEMGNAPKTGMRKHRRRAAISRYFVASVLGRFIDNH
jgi:hypothetical protein